MKQRSLLAAVLILGTMVAVRHLPALDWGLTLDNTSSIEIGDWAKGDSEVQRDKVSLWGEHFWSGGGDSRYRVLFNLYYLFTNERAFLLEPDLLKFEMTRPVAAGGAVFDLALGRFRFGDLTGIVLDHGADGIFLSLDYSVFQASVAAGYTGLHLKPEADIMMSEADFKDRDDDGVRLAPKRVFEVIRVRFPEILPRQTLALEALLQQDLRSGSETLDSFHASLRLNGALVSNFYYDLSTTGAFNLSDEEQDMLILGSLRWFGERFFGSRASVEILYAGEDFFSVSLPSLGFIYAPPAMDLLRLGLDYSFRPWRDRYSPVSRNLGFSLGGRTYHTAVDRTYQGAELEGGMAFRPSSDFGASLKAGVWMPDEGDILGLIKFDFSIGL